MTVDEKTDEKIYPFQVDPGFNQPFERIRGGITVAPYPDENALMLELVMDRDEYGGAFHTTRGLEVFALDGGSWLHDRLDDKAYTELTLTMDIYSRLGMKMPYGMYVARMDEMHKNMNSDPNAPPRVVASFLGIRKNALVSRRLIEFIDEEVAAERMVKASAGGRTHGLASVLEVMEGMHVGQNRPIGDLKVPLFVSYGSLLWKVHGYMCLTRRMRSEWQSLEADMSDQGTALSSLMQHARNWPKIGRLLESRLFYTSTRHQKPDRPTLELMRAEMESEFYCFLRDLRP